MKVLKTIGIGLLILVVLLVVISFFLPSKVKVERSTEIKAEPAVVFDQVNNFRNWYDWSPWHLMDTAMKSTYKGPESGEGAFHSWESKHERVGNGAQKIVESKPYNLIKTELYFTEEDTSRGYWKFEDQNGTTKVTWGMKMNMGMNPVSKYFGIMMKNMVGSQFEKGLSNLKEYCEELPAYAQTDIKKQQLPYKWYITLADTIKNANSEAISAAFGRMFGTLGQFMQKEEIRPTGPPISLYQDFKENNMVVEAGMPVGDSVEVPEKYNLRRLGGKVVTAIHKGAYGKLPKTHEHISKWIKDHELSTAGKPWEVYLTDPQAVTDTASWRTEVHYPVK